MANNIVQADYEALSEIIKRFSQSAQMIQQMQQATKTTADQLRDGGWIGRGSEAFFKEMDDEATPAVQRLIEALIEAGQVTEQIRQLLRQAEEEAARPIPGNVERAIGGAAAGGASADDGTGSDGDAGTSGGTGMGDGEMPGYYIPKDWLSGVERNGVLFGNSDLNDGGVPKDWLSDVESIFGETAGTGGADSGTSGGSGSADVGGTTGGDSGGGASPAENVTTEPSASHESIAQQWGSGFGVGSVLGWSSARGIAPIPSSGAVDSLEPVLTYQPIGDFPPGDNVGPSATSSATLHPLKPHLTPLPPQPDPVQTGGPVKLTWGLVATSPFVAMLGKAFFGKDDN